MSAVLLSETANASRWAVSFAGRVYNVTTYPGSDIVRMETLSGRKVQGVHIERKCRQMIDAQLRDRPANPGPRAWTVTLEWAAGGRAAVIGPLWAAQRAQACDYALSLMQRPALWRVKLIKEAGE